jgi:hypothetical protein
MCWRNRKQFESERVIFASLKFFSFSREAKFVSHISLSEFSPRRICDRRNSLRGGQPPLDFSCFVEGAQNSPTQF